MWLAINLCLCGWLSICLETIKALSLRPRAFICFSVFGTPNETLALVFDILRKKLFGEDSICMVNFLEIPRVKIFFLIP